MTYKTLLDMENKCQLLAAVLLINENKRNPIRSMGAYCR